MALALHWRRELRLRWISGCSVVLIGTGILLFSYPALPAAQFGIQQSARAHPSLQALLPDPLKAPDLSPPLSGNWLVIPSINVKEQIWEGSSLNVLWTREGVWHQTGDPGHNLVLAGHRFQYLPPNTHTFYNLDKLHPGDTVTLVWAGMSTRYAVASTEVVTPGHIEILDQTQTPELTLYTCSDWDTTRRLVVLAKPVLGAS